MRIEIHLIRSFGNTFYRQYAGILIASFVLLLSYGIFIKTAGHIPKGQERTIYLVLLLNFIQSPIITLTVLALWFLYTIKTWFFIAKLSKTPAYFFWYYSATALPYRIQIAAWWLLQLYLSLPLLFYWALAIAYAVIVGNMRLAFFTGIYLFFLTALSSVIHVYRFNFLILKTGSKFNFVNLFRKVPKPVFSFLIFELLTNQKLVLLLTKGVSCSLIVGAVSLFLGIDAPFRFTALLALTISLCHVLIIYLTHNFYETRLYFLQLLPLGRVRRYLYDVIGLFLLLLPEFTLMAMFFPLQSLPLAVSVCLGGLLFLRSLLYFIGSKMLVFLKWSFTWFCIAVLFSLFDAYVQFCALNLVSAFVIFYFKYYRRQVVGG